MKEWLALIFIASISIYWILCQNGLFTDTTEDMSLGLQSVDRHNIQGLRSTVRHKCLYQLQPCSTQSFLQFFTDFSTFPENGTWCRTSSHQEVFKPSFCSFQEFDLGECLKKNHIHSVLVLGDSNGMRYFQGLRKMLIETAHVQCTLSKREQDGRHPPSKQYFLSSIKSIPYSALSVSKRNCSSCKNQLYRCSSSAPNNSHSDLHIQLEYNSMYSLNDTSLSYNDTTNQTASSVYTFQEFLFKIYLKDSYPDLVLICLPYNHEKLHGVSQVMARLKALVELVQQSRTYNSQVIWLTTTAEVEYMRLKKEYVNKRYEGMLATDKIYQLNKATFDVLKPYLSHTRHKMSGFVNLVNMSRHRSFWSIDGIHYKEIWYKHVITNLLSTLCQP